MLFLILHRQQSAMTIVVYNREQRHENLLDDLYDALGDTGLSGRKQAEA